MGIIRLLLLGFLVDADGLATWLALKPLVSLFSKVAPENINPDVGCRYRLDPVTQGLACVLESSSATCRRAANLEKRIRIRESTPASTECLLSTRLKYGFFFLTRAHASRFLLPDPYGLSGFGHVPFLKSVKAIRFRAGQPLGYYASWPLFTLTHHLVVMYCASKVIARETQT